MKKTIWIVVLCVLLTVSAVPASAAGSAEDLVILYENDAHCEVTGYAKLAAMKQELLQTHAHVGVVSSGDFIQGSSYGVVSQGEYIVRLMNLVGYDAVALGNHEFDYRLPRLEELLGMLDAAAVCCNFEKLDEAAPYFAPYTMVSYGDTAVAYLGITTPATITTASPTQFRDENGAPVYTFHSTDLYEVVQAQIDSARADGADYVIALSHIGSGEVEALIGNTEGFDAVLDAHTHSVIEGDRIPDKGGNPVLLSSTGTKFEHIGKLTISGGELKTELIRTEDYPAADPAVEDCVRQIEEEYAALGQRKVAFSEVDLITQDAEGNRLVRIAETNLGDLCAEAFRTAVDADIGYINGGGVRADLLAGDITYNDLLGVLPFNNTIVLAEIDGRTLRDMLEMAMMDWPEEGSFPHLSGLTFSFNTQIPSSVVLNEQEEFCEVDGPYRVYDIKVYDREKGRYEPVEPTDTYTIASHNYYLLEHGSGLTMLEHTRVLKNSGILDVEALERYIVEDLGGVVGEQYREMSPNITFTEGETGTGAMGTVLLIGGFVIAAAVVVLLVLRMKKRTGRKHRGEA